MQNPVCILEQKTKIVTLENTPVSNTYRIHQILILLLFCPTQL